MFRRLTTAIFRLYMKYLLSSCTGLNGLYTVGRQRVTWARVYSNSVMKIIFRAVNGDDLLPRGQICIAGSTWTNLTFCSLSHI